MAEDEKKCFFCGNACGIYPTPGAFPIKQYECEYCGVYKLAEYPGVYNIDIKDPSIKFKMACVLNERRLKGLDRIVLVGTTDTKGTLYDLTPILIDDVLDEFPKKASDFFNRALLNLSRLAELPFDVIKLNMIKDYVHLFTRHTPQGLAFLRDLAEEGLIRTGSTLDVFSLTTKFWEIVENLQKTEVGNKRAFVAMWFDKSMDDYYRDGIKKAIEEAGYVPVRIDLKDFNEKICDEIIAEIRRDKFMIADCSEYRTGVFFEAGFAKGLGREVIFTVRKEDVDKLKEHFDTRQYNHIVYDSPEDLRKKLYNRIGATIV